MKKTAVWLLLAIVVFLSLPAETACGAQDSARIAGYSGEMVLGADGSLTVEEYVTWHVSGSPVLTRRLDVSNATAVEDISVYRVAEADPADPRAAQRVPLGRSDKPGADTYTYEITEEASGRYLELTLRPDMAGRYLTLVFSYRLTDCAYLYQDGAAYSFNPLWQAGEGTLGSFYMHCRVGEDIEQGEGTPRYYANGGITEQWTGPDLYSSEVDLSTGLEVVAVLPASWVPQGRKAVKNNILPHLDAQQQIYRIQREELYAQRQKALARGRLTLWVAVGVMAGGMILIFLLYGIRPPRPRQRSVLSPGKSLPAEACLLMRKPLTRWTALAALVHLWHRGFVRLIPGPKGQWTLKPEKRSDGELSLHEQYLLSWMLHHSGEANGDIRVKLSDATAFGVYKRLVKKSVDQKGILKEARGAWVIGLGLGVMEWVLAAMIAANTSTWDTALLVALMGVLVAGYGCLVRKVTPEEVRERARYQTYAQQLKQQEGCAGPWKRQLAYAMALGADGPLLRALYKEGRGEVKEFASWVRHQRLRMLLPVWNLSSKPQGGHRLPNIPAPRRETGLGVEKRRKTMDLRYRKPDRRQWVKAVKPIGTTRNETAAGSTDTRGTRPEIKHWKPDPKHRLPRTPGDSLKRR